ncbi:phosphatidylinositol 4-kinase gamma-like protein [Actinidia rufa]|uniref:1-phosphatidylinositol 4-kinase n=1 Tax=Actinidia rufa TaxID=165716 RepID=A0A7J0ECV9_9ERIC|nr:phosphatidylinositol 4-kinase gamma-like protein [Actinidia rufa]
MFMKNSGSCEDMGPGAFPVDEVHKISVLDIRLANADRHAGNILVQRDGEGGEIVLIPIDHGYCLPDNFKIAHSTGSIGVKLTNPIPPTPSTTICTMLLKKGAERGLTSFAIGSIMCGETLKKESVIEHIIREAEEAVLPGTSEATFLESVSLIMDRHLVELFP